MELADKTLVPPLFFPCGNDDASVKEGGTIINLLKAKFGDKCEVLEFPDQPHGFASQGNVDDPIVARDVDIAILRTLAYLRRIFG